ncbi:hypothetical protein [Maribellus sp. YY47]|uniref:hypothetical protein n=1 Tax=Maribellus sp. YY47 TaxID=2929486 RepID=UPI002000C547|nr:hypothetical protein [Maribellus sp. YY47]MCK3683042.1 hypothetical protein [Maribellus sp. YY47]
MNNKQAEIYKGLKTIGNEIAAFYATGIRVADSEYEAKAYLLAHIAREIEGGLRDVLILKKEDIQVCPTCAKPTRKTTHKDTITAIIKALGIEKEEEFIKKWFDVANKFHKYAHRHGAWREPKEKEAFTNLWNDFTVILERLVGNYYSISSLLDIYLNTDFPENNTTKKGVLGTLNNVLTLDARYVYFFKNLTNRTWLKPLYDEGYFSGDKNPLPQESEENPGYFTVPYWTIFEFLLKVAEDNLKQPDKETTLILLDIIDDINTYCIGEERIVNFRTDHSLCQLIGLLPSENIDEKHFNLIKEALVSSWGNSLISSDLDKIFMDRFIREKHTIFIMRLLDIILSYVETNGFGNDKVVSLMDEYWFGQLLANRKDDFLSICPTEIYELVTEKIKEITAKYEYVFDNISTPTIEEHTQNLFPERYTSQVTFLLRDCLHKISNEEILEKVNKLLESKIPVFNRVAIHTINNRYDILGDLFWNWKQNPLIGSFEGQYKHELYELLKNHTDEFNEDQIGKILKWIEEKEYYVSPRADEELSKKIVAYQKKEWLSSILSNKDKRIKSQFEEYHSINDSELSHPGFDVWHGEAIVGYESPLTQEQIDGFSLAETIGYFEKYRNEPKSFSGPSIEGLSEIIVSDIRNNPEKYCSAELIIKSSYQFQYSWMRGLREAEDEKVFDLECVLQVTENIFKEERFWEINNTTEHENFPNLYITEFLRLVDYSLSKDHKSLGDNNLQRIKSLLIMILIKDEKIPFDFDELSMKALNNSKGVLYNAIFQYLLKFSRDNEDKEKLHNELEEVVGALLTNNVSEDLLYFSFGRFLPYINIAHPDWVNANVSIFFNKDNIPKFNATACGYFFYNPRFYLNEFKLLNEKGIYEKALDYDFSQEERGAINNLVHHVVVALVEDIIPIDDILVNKLIQSKIEQHQSSLIYKFWSPKRTLIEKEKRKVVPLYIKIVTTELEKNETERNVALLSGISKWFNSMDNIDEEVYKLQLLISDVLNSSDRYSFIESLQKHVDAQPEMVGNLLVSLFENHVEYDISRGTITKLTEKLYQLGFKDIADKICLLHAERGIDILKELYKRNQN